MAPRVSEETEQNLYHLAVCCNYSDATMVGDESYFHVVGLEQGMLLKDDKTAALVPKARMTRVVKKDADLFGLGKTCCLWQPLPELHRYMVARDIGRIDTRRVACVLRLRDGETVGFWGLGTGQLHGCTWSDIEGMVCPSFALARISGQTVVRVVELYMEDLRNDDLRRQIAVSQSPFFEKKVGNFLLTGLVLCRLPSSTECTWFGTIPRRSRTRTRKAKNNLAVITICTRVGAARVGS